ncbi:cyclic pyranopterin monophosphate synthase MoaC [Corticibacter populi]|uniref:Cyclic pyranopterin monophosphate synthase n=1 Tax=Corticibacter populi TaxID=1550736 RepID=A0A3M6QJ16_9BURK|nr:cyclic pyranopterin monophosphate synthase MoaC [Corticibacter populi]RMX03043.1 cyclic pyranopterin monophosphate synthase MoaC [Corticibacter populi]RZS33479.1 cyclic pyranopterin monophosphate synthase subunit MoaC [Corticibacter populi]
MTSQDPPKTAPATQPLSHFDAQGQAWMVDVGHKSATHRKAVAEGSIQLSAATFAALKNPQDASPKGDVLGVARIAAIQGAKQTAALIPLCHPLPLTHLSVAFALDEVQQRVRIEVTAETVGKTGVEMEALTGASVGLLTIYDMLKAIDKGMVIERIALVSKQGGKSGAWARDSGPSDPA